MTDRELLELAAKAAGLTVAKWADGGPMHLGPVAIIVQEDGLTYGWRPLTDDGDALRLAVQLRISVTMSEFGRVVCRAKEWTMATLPYGDDPRAATRRAIVKAAAQMAEDATPL